MKKPPAPPAPALRVEYLRVRDIPPATLNPKRHAGKAIEASIGRFGYVEPMVLDGRTGRLVAGHGRREALLAIEGRGGPAPAGIEARADGWYAPVLVGWSSANDEEAGAFLLATNKLTEAGGWDAAELGAAIERVRASVDLTQFGFSSKDLAQAIQAARDIRFGSTEDPDAIPPVPIAPASRLGDLWVLGQHRVLCGDATNPSHVARVLQGATPFLMVTDPPYGVDYDPEWREGGVDARQGKVTNDDRVDWSEAFAMFRGGVAYVWHASLKGAESMLSIQKCGFEVRAQLVWRKPYAAMSRGAYHWQHEPCWYAVRGGSQAKWIGDRKQSTVWDATQPNDPYGRSGEDETPHSTQKPVAIMERPIRNHDAPEVYDPFLGSGTTIIAAERASRVCYGLEIDPGYCDVIVSRWERTTGKKAEIERK